MMKCYNLYYSKLIFTETDLCRVAAVKGCPKCYQNAEYIYIYTTLSMGIISSIKSHFENRMPLKPFLGDMADVVFSLLVVITFS